MARLKKENSILLSKCFPKAWIERNSHRVAVPFSVFFQPRNFLFFCSNAACSNPRTFALILSRASLILEKWEIPGEASFYGTGISVCQFSPFPPAATDCEMKFYIKLRLSSFFLASSPFVLSLSRCRARLPTPLRPSFSSTSSGPRSSRHPLYIYVPIDRYVGVCIYIDTVTPPAEMPNI